MTDNSEKRIKYAVTTAINSVHATAGMTDIWLKRFNRAMDALEPGEGEVVYDRLCHEGWYEMAAKALAANKT